MPINVTICNVYENVIFCIISGYLDSLTEIFHDYNQIHRFWYDLLAVFPFEVFSFFGCNRLSVHHNVCYLRLNRLLNFLRNVPLSFAIWEKSLHVHIVKVRTMKLIMYVYFITHMVACLYYWFPCGYNVIR